MMAQAYEPAALAPLPTMMSIAMSRPQVGIERLPTRRMSNEPRESMNCKSCRKRKIKCNRLRPACEACTVFQCPCIYDAVPKKRGPKTDVLEALLKRVDGLEAQLKEKKPDSEEGAASGSAASDDALSSSSRAKKTEPKGPALDAIRIQEADESATLSPASEPSPSIQTDVLLDTYFSRFHAKPFHVVDESPLRQRLQLNQVPAYLLNAIFAVAARYTLNPRGHQAAVNLSEDYAMRSRTELDVDEPSVDALQALLLLVTAFTGLGKGKKAYMLLTNAVGMAMALELHREMDMAARVTPVEREMRRRLFWTCYLLDRFLACGSKRPSLIGDKGVLLRLPCWSPNPAALPVEGDFFQSGSNLQYLQGSGKKSQGSSGMLIDIARILGVTNRYLAAGGVKGDSHFPWHSLSNLSRIRQDLDVWASGTEDVFSSVDTLFGQPDSTVLVLSKLIYHLIHCLIYRPFLPIDLSELAGPGQHQSWQIEATNMCFMHANAIAELVELGKQTNNVEWPAFVGYCLATAGTVHIHGTHYGNAGDMNAFASSADFLSREMQHLNELRYTWASVQHQRETLQAIYSAHSEVVKTVAANPARFPPVFHLEDFFDRYSNVGGPGGPSFSFDAANLSLSDVVVDFSGESYTGHDIYAARTNGGVELGAERLSLKRKSTALGGGRRRSELKSILPLGGGAAQTTNHGLLTPSHPRQLSFSQALAPQQSPGMMHPPASLQSHSEMLEQQNTHLEDLQDQMGDSSGIVANGSAGGFSLPTAHHGQNQVQGLSMLSGSPFSPQFSFAQLHPHQQQHQHASATSSTLASAQQQQHQQQQHYDPMFGGMATNAFSSPVAWQGDDGHAKQSMMVVAPSPGAGSQHGSAGTGPGDEKDPFLSLLEQLAENESIHGPGHELDFFLSGTPGTGRV